MLIKPSDNDWQLPTGLRALAPGDIDLWRVDLDSDPASIEEEFDLLSTDERARADRFVFAKDRNHFVAGRAALRKIIGGYLKVAPNEVAFYVRQYGKPYVAGEDGGLRFNVSHSNGIAAIAVSQDREVGVDVEFVDRRFDVFSVASTALSAAEVSRIKSLPSELHAEAFFAAWTRKEALLKAVGDGLSSSTELQTAVSFVSDVDDSFRSFENKTATDWSLVSFDIDDDFKAALAVEGRIGSVSHLKTV